MPVISAWVQITLILGGSFALWGWWGVFLATVLGVVLWLGYEFYKYVTLDLETAVRLTGVKVAQGVYADAPHGFPSVVRDKEAEKRRARERRLHHLDTDLEHAGELMRLEERAHVLRTKYAQRVGRYSRDVKDDLDSVFADIEALKRGRNS